MPWESLGSTTFRRADMAAGIEPDDGFSIQHHAAMVGKERVDLRVDPPPDLVIAVEITSPTALQAYPVLQVPEIWPYHNRTLQIAVWQEGRYIDTPYRPTFPQVPVSEAIAQFVEMSHVRGTAPAWRAFRQWVREQLQP